MMCQLEELPSSAADAYQDVHVWSAFFDLRAASPFATWLLLLQPCKQQPPMGESANAEKVRTTVDPKWS